MQTDSGEPIPYATVVVRSSDSLNNDGTYTDDKGGGLIQVPTVGKYLVSVSFVGFATASQEVYIPTDKTLRFRLAEDAKLLQSVTVVGRKRLISIEPTGAVAYNMAADPAGHTEDLLTAMRRVPMVIVDGQGNMQVKGTSNFSIYLNGKPFRSATLSPAQVLAGIPASSVSKVEVITNPDASYAAESGSTIINIVTGGKKIDGYNLRLSAEGTSKPIGVGSVSFNMIKGRFKLSTAYDYRIDHQKDQPSGSIREISLPDGTHSALRRKGIGDGTWQIHTGRVMAEYEIDSIRSFYADMHVNYMGIHAKERSSQSFYRGLAEADKFLRVDKQDYNEGAVESNLLYRRQDRRSKQDFLSLGYRFSYNPDNRYNESSIYNEVLGDSHVRSLSDGGMYEHTFSFDVLFFRNKHFTLKAGLLDVLRFADSKPHYYTKPTADAPWEEISKSGHERLDQRFNTVATYLAGTYRLGKTSFNAGARVEYVSSEIRQAESAKPSVECYVNFVPRASVTTAPTDASQLTLAYYYGVSRPSIWNLNPYTSQVDDYSAMSGNPDLSYGREHSFSFSALAFGDKYFVNLSADYTLEKNPIYRYNWIESTNSQTLFGGYVNGERTQRAALSSSVNYRPVTWLSLNVYGDIGWYFFKEKAYPEQRAFSYNIQGSCDVTLPRNYRLGGLYMYTHMAPTLQGTYGHDHIYSVYATKSFWKGLIELTLLANSPFRKYGHFTSTERGRGFNQYRWNDILSQSIGIRITFNLRSGKESRVERDRSLQQSDLDTATGVQ